MRIRMWCSSDRGLVRENNEDAALAGNVFVRDSSVTGEFSREGLLPFLVADGMGGHANGEVASQMAITAFQRHVASLDVSQRALARALEAGVRGVHQELLNKASEFGDYGSTLCGVVFAGANRVFLVNVGDSRLYRARGRYLRQISVDHSLRQETGNPAIPGNWLTSVLGGGSQGLKVCVKEITRLVQPGDTLLICSDGLSEYVPHNEILAAMRPAIASPDKELVAAALAGGGHDNITCLVLRME